MKKILLSLAVALISMGAVAQVKPGIEVLRDNDFAQLKGKKVGLITNPTGIDNDFKSTIDILHEAEGVELVALYAPEHGVRGDVHAGDAVDASVDPATGVPVHSIYGKNHKPTAEMLKDVDVLIYDIQDNGCRSYTFISSMGKAMEACAELGKEFMVLDRPNPLGGNKVEGCLAEKGFISFVSQFPIPYLYGLTPGELAIYLNEEGLLSNGVKVELEVVPMEGWSRDMSFQETGMPWVLPSPHIPNADIALYYPATGILGELYSMSIGVGYTLPFKMVGAPWVDGQELAKRLNDLAIPGMYFRGISAKPFYSTFKGENIGGVEIYITDKDEAPLTLAQFYILEVLADMYPDKDPFELCKGARLDMFDKVTGTSKIRELFTKNYKVDDIFDYWTKDDAKFKMKKARYHLYK